jgi:sugar (pentulose or hexulose) kinase
MFFCWRTLHPFVLAINYKIRGVRANLQRLLRAAILAMVGVGAYPYLEAAFEILSQESNTVQPQANAVYEEGFKRYKLLYEALKAAR